MDNIIRTWEDSEPTEAELELTDAQLELIYGGCGGSCPADAPDDDSDGGW